MELQHQYWLLFLQFEQEIDYIPVLFPATAPHMEKHLEFTDWAISKGVQINGIAAHKFPGRGLGIIAEKKHKVSNSLIIGRKALVMPRRHADGPSLQS